MPLVYPWPSDLMTGLMSYARNRTYTDSYLRPGTSTVVLKTPRTAISVIGGNEIEIPYATAMQDARRVLNSGAGYNWGGQRITLQEFNSIMTVIDEGPITVAPGAAGGTIQLDIDQDLSDGRIVVIDQDNITDPVPIDPGGKLLTEADNMADSGFGLDDLFDIGFDILDGGDFDYIGAADGFLSDDDDREDQLPDSARVILDDLGFTGNNGKTTRDQLDINRGVNIEIDANEVTGKTGKPVIADISYEQRARCPRGYVAATLRATGQKVCMDRGYAIQNDYYRPQTKPPITAADMKCISKASRARSRIDKIQAKARAIGMKKKC